MLGSLKYLHLCPFMLLSLPYPLQSFFLLLVVHLSMFCLTAHVTRAAWGLASPPQSKPWKLMWQNLLLRLPFVLPNQIHQSIEVTKSLDEYYI